MLQFIVRRILTLVVTMIALSMMVFALSEVVPIDPACLARAAELGCRYDVRTLDALHLAAADRLPQPLVMLTFDRRQADAARAMGLAVEGA